MKITPPEAHEHARIIFVLPLKSPQNHYAQKMRRAQKNCMLRCAIIHVYCQKIEVSGQNQKLR
jgi:hypothetical protein